jgi:hypothetical protein
MTHEIHRRILRGATPEEQERHRTIREEIKQELPELKQWARETAARHHERVAVGTVFTDQESDVLEAIDDYATKHSIKNRASTRPQPRSAHRSGGRRAPPVAPLRPGRRCDGLGFLYPSYWPRATRKPRLLFRHSGESQSRNDACAMTATSYQHPPRFTRSGTPTAPVGSTAGDFVS